jgi:hypothetical protein
MTSPYKLFETNTELEAGKGVKLQYPGFSITINRAGGANKKFAQVFAAKMKPHRQRFERGLMDNETGDRIVIESYAEGVVIGWEGVTDREGNPIPFSVENCVKLFVDLPELFEDVRSQATAAATFREEIEKVEEKN